MPAAHQWLQEHKDSNVELESWDGYMPPKLEGRLIGLKPGLLEIRQSDGESTLVDEPAIRRITTCNRAAGARLGATGGVIVGSIFGLLLEAGMSGSGSLTTALLLSAGVGTLAGLSFGAAVGQQQTLEMGADSPDRRR